MKNIDPDSAAIVEKLLGYAHSVKTKQGGERAIRNGIIAAVFAWEIFLVLVLLQNALGFSIIGPAGFLAGILSAIVGLATFIMQGVVRPAFGRFSAWST